MNDRRFTKGEIIKVSTAAFTASPRHMEWDKYVDAEVLLPGPTSANQVYVSRCDRVHVLYVRVGLIANS